MSQEQSSKRVIEMDGQYAEQAYCFVLDGVLSAVSRRSHTRKEHISAAELVHLLLKMAKEKYGAYARGVFHGWGISTSMDFGNIVFQLAKANRLTTSSDDVPDSFSKAADLDAELTLPFENQEPYPDMPIIV